MEVFLTEREVEFELCRGVPRNPLHRRLLTTPSIQAFTESLTMGASAIEEIWRVMGEAAYVDGLARDLASAADADRTVRISRGAEGGALVVEWTSVRRAGADAISPEQVLLQVGGRDVWVGLRIADGRLFARARSGDGETLLRLYEQSRGLLASAFEARLVRLGDPRRESQGRAAPAVLAPRAGPSLRDDEAALVELALERGYYDEPKRCGVRELGAELGFSKSVVARKLRTIERKALEQMREPGAPGAPSAPET